MRTDEYLEMQVSFGGELWLVTSHIYMHFSFKMVNSWSYDGFNQGLICLLLSPEGDPPPRLLGFPRRRQRGSRGPRGHDSELECRRRRLGKHICNFALFFSPVTIFPCRHFDFQFFNFKITTLQVCLLDVGQIRVKQLRFLLFNNDIIHS